MAVGGYKGVILSTRYVCTQLGKAVALSDFDRGKIVTARQLRTNISEIAKLIRCSQAAVVSTHKKWKNGEIVNRRLALPCFITERGHRRLSCLEKQNRWLPVAQLTIQVKAQVSLSTLLIILC